MAAYRFSGSICFRLGAAAFAFLVSAVTANAHDFYKGQTITLILGSPSGGGYDSYARPLARYLGKHIPGNPTVILQNMPGAGGLRADNYIYNVAPKDGLTIGMASAASLFEPLFGNSETKFETPKFNWLGNMDEIVGTCDVWSKSGINHFDEMLEKDITFGAAGAGSASTQLPTALRNLLGARITLVTGYPGATEVNLAMKRGEVEGTCGISLAALKSVYAADYNSGQLKPIIQFSTRKHPELPGVAHIYDYAKNDDDRGVFDLIFGRYVLGRPVMAPPGVPADRVKILQKAFMDTMTDPEFQAEAEKSKIEVNPISGEEVNETVKRFFSYPKAVVTRAMTAMQ
jgi:tripartite-type tricarboxylate transporter receptor subunit TctC